LLLSGKNNVAVLGAGKDRTILQATDPQHSAFIVQFASNVRLSGFQVYSPNLIGAKRRSNRDARGFLVRFSSGVVLDSVKVRQVISGGIALKGVRDSKVLNSEVVRSLADAFHVTGGSEHIVLQGNLAEGAGDDGFASIGYGNEINNDIQFLDNVVRDGSRASGISFEGTNGGKAYRNRIYRSGAAGIRIASQKNWNTGPSDNLDLQDNYLEGCVTRPDIGHASVMIFTNFKYIGPNVSIRRTTIKNPARGPGFRAYGAAGATVAARVDDSSLSGVKKAFKVEQNATILNSNGKLLSSHQSGLGVGALVAAIFVFGTISAVTIYNRSTRRTPKG
jgi:hypothetical protein